MYIQYLSCLKTPVLVRSTSKLTTVAVLMALIACAITAPSAAQSTTPFERDHCLISVHGQADDAQLQASNVLDGFQNSNSSSTMVIYFHGGLDTQDVGLKIAHTLSTTAFSTGVYPVYFVWNSDFDRALATAYPDLRRNVFFMGVLALIEKHYAGPTGNGGIAEDRSTVRLHLVDTNGTDNATDQAFESDLATDPTITAEAEAQHRSLELAADDRIHSMMNAPDATMSVPESVPERTMPTFEPQVPSTESIKLGLIGQIEAVVEKVKSRLKSGRGHGPTGALVRETAVEELAREFKLGPFGTGIWSDIKHDTETAFSPSPTAIGTAFASSLAALIRAGHGPKRIVLIGHSAGAIYLCNFIRAMDSSVGPDVRFDVVFIAPACSYEKFARTLHAYPNRIAHFRMFGLSDPIESTNALAGPLYPSSLLYLISGVLECESDEPIVGMERFLSEPIYSAQYPDVAYVQGYLSSIPNALVWSVSNAGPGLNSGCKTHGGFSDDSDTQKSLAALTQQWQ